MKATLFNTIVCVCKPNFQCFNVVPEIFKTITKEKNRTLKHSAQVVFTVLPRETKYSDKALMPIIVIPFCYNVLVHHSALAKFLFLNVRFNSV